MEQLFVSCTPGLEPALEVEARAFGQTTRVPGGVELRGDAGLYRRANLELRTASRVMLELARIRKLDELKRITLDPFVPRGEGVELDVHSRSQKFPARALREAIPKKWPIREGGATLRVRGEGDEITVSIDTSGELLHRRGYRQETSHAPLRESLAAGVLKLSGYNSSEPLWDPMCGSGTLLIEAAWMALQRAPGLDRTFAFERWPSHDAAAWTREKAEAQSRIASTMPAPIVGTDINAGALGVARRNARRAGLEGKLKLERHDATKPRSGLGGPGLVVANLPYGKRVGRDTELEKLYRDLVAALRQSVPGWRVALFAADAKALASLDVRWSATHALDNGGIPCTLVVGAL
ncbi:MAG: RNA methyltransferase [Deltaproteobacteria bacterium]|nr:RNA methyltransferase [Deltaproteobacteria bacterium]